MRTRNTIYITLIIGTLSACHRTPAYKNNSLPTEKRVEDLLSRMTLEEKAAQLDMLSANEILNDSHTFNEIHIHSFIDSMDIGSIHDLYPQSAFYANILQKHAVEKSRLGIPLLFIEEALHGYQGAGATTFPIPQGNASTWDTTLMYNIGRVIGTEARAHGIHFVLGPNLDLARDIRWGRVEETFGEDVYLSSRMAVNMIKGLQGRNLTDNNTVIAEPKHFVMHGSPENGSNESPVSIGEREVRSTGLYVFEKAVKEGKAKGIMAAYHEIDGIPCVANKWLLTNVLRNEWGFDGLVLTDLGAIKKQITTHKTANNDTEAIINAVSAGVDMQFYDFPHTDFQHDIIESIKNGKLSKADLDRAVKDILRVKFMLGLFDNPYTDLKLVSKRFHTKEHSYLALEAARESIILLKNKNNVLPLKDVKIITLAGSLANTTYTGGYSPVGAKAISVYEALKEKFGNKIKINYLNNEISDKFCNISSTFLSRDIHSSTNDLKVEFFNNKNLNGAPSYSTTDANLNFYWHNLSPAPGINSENFSARWSGYISVPVSGKYEIDFRADDLGRVYINDQLFINHWDLKWQNRSEIKSIYLNSKQKIPFCLEFSKLNDNAGIWLKWRLIDTEKLNLFSEITHLGSQSDVVLVVMGETQEEVGENRDKYDLNPNNMDMKILQSAAKSGKPVITILITGRPLILTEVSKLSNALLQTWFGGEAAGTAIVEILNGDYNPSGRLTISFPENQGQLPIYYSKKPSAKRQYIDGKIQPLYPFGYGLSYSTFKYHNLIIRPENPRKTDNIFVNVDITNTSLIDGYEVVQLYLNDKVSSVEIPEKQLKGFAKIFVKAGETKTVTIKLTSEQLSLINIEMRHVVEPGEFEIMIGSSSEDIKLRKSFFIK